MITTPPSESSGLKKKYYSNLDTIRFIAVFFVVGFHWLPFLGRHPWGQAGVDIFFVLSGFLISEILFKSKQEIANHPSLKIHAIKTFYIKRALRIFPIYYLLVFLFFVWKQPPIGGDWVYLFTYTTNFLIYFKNHLIDPLSHLWSLSVEEQFYMVWPFFIFFINKKWYPHLISTVLITSLLFIFFHAPENYLFILPPVCMSTLGMGALLAYLKTEKEALLLRFAPFLLPVSLLTGAILLFSTNFSFIIQHVLGAIMAFSLITYAIISRNRSFNKIFSNPVTSYLGKISYGIYLYHNPVPWVVRSLNGTETAIVRHFPILLPAFRNKYAIVIEDLVFLLILSSVSWFLIEKPINSFKARYNKRQESAMSRRNSPGPQSTI